MPRGGTFLSWHIFDVGDVALFWESSQMLRKEVIGWPVMSRVSLVLGRMVKVPSCTIINIAMFQRHGSLNVPIEHHPTIRYMVYNGYYKVMSNMPKMGQLPTPERIRAKNIKIRKSLDQSRWRVITHIRRKVLEFSQPLSNGGHTRTLHPFNGWLNTSSRHPCCWPIQSVMYPYIYILKKRYKQYEQTLNC